MKIVDKINANIKEGKTFFSFEYFPPRTEEVTNRISVIKTCQVMRSWCLTVRWLLLQGVENLFERLDRMVAYGPTFCDITWGAGGSTADVTLGIATKMQNLVSLQLAARCQGVQQGLATAAVQQQQYAGIRMRSTPHCTNSAFRKTHTNSTVSVDTAASDAALSLEPMKRMLYLEPLRRLCHKVQPALKNTCSHQ
jgi:hypothetical protein